MEAKKIKLLGMTIEKTASLRAHCTETTSRSQHRINLLRKLRGTSWGANTKTLLNLYKQWIRCGFDYNPAALFRASKTAKKMLSTTELKALKIALKAEKSTPSDVIYSIT